MEVAKQVGPPVTVTDKTHFYVLCSPFQTVIIANSDTFRTTFAIQINFARISSVITSDCQCREAPGAFFSIEAELVKRVELYPVNFHDTGRSAANQTFIFSIYFYVKLTDGSIARVPCDLRTCRQAYRDRRLELGSGVADRRGFPGVAF